MWRLTAVLILVQEILDLLVVVEAAQQVLEWLCLRFRLRTGATEGWPLCIMEVSTAAAVVAALVLLVHTEVQPKGAAVQLPHLRREETALLVQPRHRHRSAWRIQVAVEVEARTLWVDFPERQVGRAL
jgi:hypothetical protein